ncbi:MAG: hypothetical protein FJY15_03875 [Bacteroidetes bacterium]|nr:hypothetical protein [Bacteroidota bacterium]
MKNKFTIFSILALVVSGALFLSSFKTAKLSSSKVKVMQLTAVESLVGGGMTRSRLISSTADGSINEEDLGHFYSLVGIKFDNIRSNDTTIALKLEEYLNDGWELVSSTTTFGSSSGENGIVITRYLLKKTVE